MQPDKQRDKLFAERVDRHARLMFRVAYSLLGNRQDAEDAVQDTLLKLYRTTPEPEIEDEQAYLARCVYRTGLDRLALVSSKAMRYAEDVTTVNPPSQRASPEQQAVENSERELLRRLVAGLPEELRQPLVLSAIESMRGTDVAAALGIPEATVRTRIHRAKAELRRRFEALTPQSAEARP